jgi:hypothetical protein
MKDRVGECWFLPTQDLPVGPVSLMSEDQFLVIMASTPGRNFFVHTLICTHPDGKFEFRTMREWSMTPLETLNCKRVG